VLAVVGLLEEVAAAAAVAVCCWALLAPYK